MLNESLHLQPVGVTGEIFAGGEAVGRGYADAPTTTAERFIADPFDYSMSGARLYRTGDLGRYLRDGSIEFLGRRDYQVKVRGHRVQLGEIEVTLRQNSMVSDAAVIVRQRNNESELVAFVVPNHLSPTVNGRRRHRLPNNLAVLQLNKHETEYLYQEIFEDGCYMRNGITVCDEDVIFNMVWFTRPFLTFAWSVTEAFKVPLF